MAIAGAAFVIGAWFAFQSLEADLSQINWPIILLVALVGVPTAILLNSLEYREMGRVEGVGIPITEAARTAVLSTAANLLPFPGGVVLRSGDLMSRGVSRRASLGLNLLAGFLSVGLSGIVTLVLFRSDPLGALAGTAMLVLSLGVVAVQLRDVPLSPAHVRLLLVEVAIIAVTALRAWLIMVGLGIGGDVRTAIGIASVYPIAAMIGFFPGGLALREALAGLVTRSFGSGPSVGFLVSAVDRLIGLIVHAPIAIALARRRSAENL